MLRCDGCGDDFEGTQNDRFRDPQGKLIPLCVTCWATALDVADALGGDAIDWNAFRMARASVQVDIDNLPDVHHLKDYDIYSNGVRYYREHLESLRG